MRHPVNGDTSEMHGAGSADEAGIASSPAGESVKLDAAPLANRPTDGELRKLLAEADSDAFFSDEYLEIKEVCNVAQKTIGSLYDNESCQ